MTSSANKGRSREERPEWHKLYSLRAWRGSGRQPGLRKLKLAQDPLCERCEKRFKLVKATEVHHRRPHKGDLALFFDLTNLESLCVECHAGEAQGDEARGFSRTLGADGWPTDPNHPANRKISSVA